LLEKDLIEAVIGLAPNIFYATGLAPAVIVLRRDKPTVRKGRVLIADASSLFRRGHAQNLLDPAHAAQIVAWVSIARPLISTLPTPRAASRTQPPRTAIVGGGCSPVERRAPREERIVRENRGDAPAERAG
jgi:type I restriction-modification system DNA methylase subunit